MRFIKKFIQKLRCSIPFNFSYVGHSEFYVVRKLSEQCDLIKCKDCGREFAINKDIEQVLPYDGTIKSFYETFHGLYLIKK